jgi:predicted phage terminase large subunit-like protein
VVPTAKQWAALLHQKWREVMYGGAAGPGKSSWLLMEALLYCDDPNYAGILFRSTLPNLEREPDGLIPMSHDWLRGTRAIWRPRTRTWEFPSGATLTFGFLGDPRAHENYAGPSYRFIGFDEVTEIRSASYLFMFSRLRRTAGSRSPLRFRAAGNPGGRSHGFIRDRFGLADNTPRPGRMYIPASLDDNPHLDVNSYLRSLAELDPVTFARLRHGDWSIDETGGLLSPLWVTVVADFPRDAPRVRYWDMAASGDPSADRTAGALVAHLRGRFWILDVVFAREREPASLIANTSTRDGPDVPVVIEQEPGSSGVQVIDWYKRDVLSGRSVHGDRPTGSKVARAQVVAGIAANTVTSNGGYAHVPTGNLMAVRPEGQLAGWIDDLFDEMRSFPTGGHDDLVDALTGAVGWLRRKGPRPARLSVAGGVLPDPTR